MSLATVENSSDRLAVFHRTLAELCRADVPLPRAFRLLQSDLRKGKLFDALAEMSADVEAGMPFDQAYARHIREFPPLYRALVEAGMASGDLPAVLEEIARHAAHRALVAAKLRRALAYPMMSAMLVLLIGGSVLLFVAPRTWQLAEGAGVESPLPLVLGSLTALAVLIGSAFVFTWLFSPIDAGKGMGFRTPFVGRLRVHAAKASFAATMALLTRRRVPLPQALRLAAEATGDRRVRRSVARMAMAAREGAGLADSVRAGGLLEPSLLWLVETAEGGGAAHAALDDVARVHRRRLDRAAERLAVTVTPVAELILGIVVFACAYGFMVPLFRYAVSVFSLG